MKAIQRSRIYTVSGETGVGTSSTAGALIKALEVKTGEEYQLVMGGAVMGEVAESLGFKKNEKDKIASYNLEHPEAGFDKLCDAEIVRRARSRRSVVDNRIGGYFLPEALNSLQTCPKLLRAIRRWIDPLQTEDESVDVYEIYAEIIRRDWNDNTRFAKMYPGYKDKERFHIPLYSDRGRPHELARRILDKEEELLRA